MTSRTGYTHSGSVEKVELHPRPFADIPNPYDHACSVLCNHPNGYKFTWMARRFVHFLQLEKTRARLGFPPITGSPFSFVRKYETYHPHQGVGGFLEDNLKQKPLLLQPLLLSSSTGTSSRQPLKSDVVDAGEEDEMNKIDRVKKKKDLNVSMVAKKGKKKKLKKKKRKKGRKVPEGAEAGKSRIGLRAASTREEVEDPLTLVEDGSENTNIRRRAVRVRKLDMVDGGEDDGLLHVTDEDRMQARARRRGSAIETDGDLDDDYELDPQKLQELEQILEKSVRKLRTARTREVDLLSEELSKRKLQKSDSWLGYPRAVHRTACRFELPVDSGTLLKMSPGEYMVKHCVLSDARRNLYRKIFLKHRDRQGQLQSQSLALALSDVIGIHLEPEDVERIRELVPWPEEAVPMKLFSVIAALTERFCCGSVTRCSQEGNRKDELEYADFESQFLQGYLSGLNLSSNLRDLLIWIGSS